MRIATQALLATLLAWAGMAVAQQRVTIATGDVSRSPHPLVAWTFMPSGPGPHPAVVMLHGCGGAYAKDGRLNARHRMWGEYLASHGYLALMLDSFTSRGVKELCTQRMAERTLRPAERAGDAFAALAWLAKRPDVDARRIGLLGWSHGGSTVLETVDQVPPAEPRFSAAIAFYPGCTPKAREGARFHPRAPLLMLVGEADDWTPPEPCKQLAAKAKGHGESVEIVSYPDTYHDFDNPALKAPRTRPDVPNGVHKGQGVTVAPNPVAREDAKKRVLAFFGRAG